MFKFLSTEKEYLLIGIGGAGCKFIDYCQHQSTIKHHLSITINNDRTGQRLPAPELLQQAPWNQLDDYCSPDTTKRLKNIIKTPRNIVVITGAGGFGYSITPFIVEKIASGATHTVLPILISPFSFEASRILNYEKLFNKITAIERSYPNCAIPKVFSNAKLLSRCSQQLSLSEFFSDVNSMIARSIGLQEPSDD